MLYKRGRLMQGRVPLLTASHNGAEDFVSVPFNLIEPVTDAIDPRIIDYAIE
jgi:hypothetical protein